MKRQARGSSNEHRTIRFLSKRNFIAVRTGGSKGMGDLDVLAYHIITGEIKHVQSKSNHGYTKQDLELLRLLRKTIMAPNVSIELWDWYDVARYPIVTIIRLEGDTTITEDPDLKKIMENKT